MRTLLLAAPLLSACSMAFPAGEWTEAAPEAQGLDSLRLRVAVEYLRAKAPKDGADELVIVRQGVVVWKGPGAEKVHGIWSCTKSFTSTVLGLLVADGKITLDTPVREVLPELEAAYAGVTFRHLATMTSGYRAEGDATGGGYTHGPSPTWWMPGPPLFPPGTKYAYWDSAMNLFGLALTRTAGEPIEELFKRRVADPIGMKKWDWGDWGVRDGLVVNGGSGNQGRHVKVHALDLARLGHLFLNRGRWKRAALIPPDWIAAATSVQVPASLAMGDAKLSPFDGRGVYGFNWWVNGLKPDGDRLWPGAPPSTFAACGHNNNRLFVIPEWKMVVVRLGLDQAPGFAIPDAVWGEFLRLVGESFLRKP